MLTRGNNKVQAKTGVKRYRALFVSDLHLGAPFRWLPADRREERRRDQRTILDHVVRESIERGVDAILIPGDLFDQEGVDAATLAASRERLQLWALSGASRTALKERPGLLDDLRARLAPS